MAKVRYRGHNSDSQFTTESPIKSPSYTPTKTIIVKEKSLGDEVAEVAVGTAVVGAVAVDSLLLGVPSTILRGLLFFL